MKKDDTEGKNPLCNFPDNVEGIMFPASELRKRVGVESTSIACQGLCWEVRECSHTTGSISSENERQSVISSECRGSVQEEGETTSEAKDTEDLK